MSTLISVSDEQVLASLYYDPSTDSAVIELGDASHDVPDTWLGARTLEEINGALFGTWQISRQQPTDVEYGCFWGRERAWCYNGYCCTYDGSAVTGRYDGGCVDAGGCSGDCCVHISAS